MRRIILAVLIAAPMLVAGCNTIAGIGKDVTAVGDAMTKSAEDVK